jgi:hypothetical protein
MLDNAASLSFFVNGEPAFGGFIGTDPDLPQGYCYYKDGNVVITTW